MNALRKVEWFTNIIKSSSSNSNCVCKWNECTYAKELDSTQAGIFWNKYNYFVAAKKSPNIFKRRVFYVKGDREKCLFTLNLGMDPTDNFEFVCTLNCFATNKTLTMSPDQIKCFFKYFKILVKTNINNPFVCGKFSSEDQKIEFKAKCELFNGNRTIYEIKTEFGVIELDATSLACFIKMEPVINGMINQIIRSIDSHKILFQRFIGLFITWSNFENLYSEENHQHFLTYLSTRVCDCGVNNDFALELALNFSGCMIKYITWYMTALLMNESVRKYTFVQHDKKYNVDTLAKTGLILFNVTPNIQCLRCVFCNKQMKEDEATHNPVPTHFKRSFGKCPLLTKAESTENIPTDGCNADLQKWILKQML